MKMTLAKALKEKNRLAGKMKVFNACRNENIYFEKDKPKIDVMQVYKKNLEDCKKMFTLKTAIAKANAEHGVCEKMYEMEELKGIIIWLNILCTDIVPVRQINPVTGNEDVTNKCAFISYEFKEAEIERIQTRIDQLQDEIDEINASATIDVDIN